MRISMRASGSFKRTETFLTKMSRGEILQQLKGFGAEGVTALAAATPKDSGETANSWQVKVKVGISSATIMWTNSHIVQGQPIAILLQYGHGTGTGGYVQGRDYINPAIRPVFDKIADRAWKAVTSA